MMFNIAKLWKKSGANADIEDDVIPCLINGEPETPSRQDVPWNSHQIAGGLLSSFIKMTSGAGAKSASKLLEGRINTEVLGLEVFFFVAEMQRRI